MCLVPDDQPDPAACSRKIVTPKLFGFAVNIHHLSQLDGVKNVLGLKVLKSNFLVKVPILVLLKVREKSNFLL